MPSDPFTSSTARESADSLEKTSVAMPPDSNRAVALTCVGTVTSNSSPALGPLAMVRVAREITPVALTEAIGPNVCTSAVR